MSRLPPRAIRVKHIESKVMANGWVAAKFLGQDFHGLVDVTLTSQPTQGTPGQLVDALEGLELILRLQSPVELRPAKPKRKAAKKPRRRT